MLNQVIIDRLNTEGISFVSNGDETFNVNFQDYHYPRMDVRDITDALNALVWEDRFDPSYA